MNEYPITSHETVLLIGKLRIIRIKNYRFKVISGVQPKHYPEEIKSVKYQIHWG